MGHPRGSNPVGLGWGPTACICCTSHRGVGEGIVMHRTSEHHTLKPAALMNLKKCDLRIFHVTEQKRTRKAQRYKTHVHGWRNGFSGPRSEHAKGNVRYHARCTCSEYEVPVGDCRTGPFHREGGESLASSPQGLEPKGAHFPAPCFPRHVNKGGWEVKREELDGDRAALLKA